MTLPLYFGMPALAFIWEHSKATSAMQLPTYSPDGKQFVSGSDDLAGRIWDAIIAIRPKENLIMGFRGWQRRQMDGFYLELPGVA